MKKLSKILAFLLVFIFSSDHISLNADEASDILGPTIGGAALGGIFGGGRGAAIGAGVGFGIGTLNASRNRERKYYYRDEPYYDDDYDDGYYYQPVRRKYRKRSYNQRRIQPATSSRAAKVIYVN
jgi:hypothetical protein